MAVDDAEVELMLVEGVLLLALDVELLLVLVLLEVVDDLEVEEMEVDEVAVELVLVEEVLPTVLYVEQLLVLVLVEFVDDLEVEEVDVDDAGVELVLVEEVPVFLLLLMEVLDVEVALGLDVDVPVEPLHVLLDVVGRCQVVEDQPINLCKRKLSRQRQAKAKAAL